MANSKISALTAQTTLADTDMLVVANSGSTTKKITALNAKKDASFTKATSMPATPATNQMCFRTDLGLLFYYDGTRWLTVTKYVDSMPAKQGIVGSEYGSEIGSYQDLDMWVEKLIISTYVATTNNGSSYWTFRPFKSSTAAAQSYLAAIQDTSADAANTRVVKSFTVGASVVAASFPVIGWEVLKVSGPGAVNFEPTILYRLIGT